MTPGNGIPPHDSADKSLGDIVSDVSEKASALVRGEIELAKAEVTEKVSKLGKGAGIAAAAGVFLVFAITMFFHALAWFFTDLFDWSPWAGFLLTAGILTVLAAVAAFIAYRLFQKGSPPMPDMAIEQAKLTRAELEAQTIDRVQRTREKGEEVKT
jgi:uncharacterized membrane protein YqjE